MVRDRLFSFAMVLGLGVVLLVSLVMGALFSVAGKLAWRILPHALSWVASLALHGAVSFVATAGIFATIFKVLPDVRLRWRDVGWGAFLTASLFSIGRVVIGLYLGSAAIGSPFGAAGSLVVLLAWVYYSSLILYLGAQFTHELAVARDRIPEPKSLAMRIVGPPEPA